MCSYIVEKAQVSGSAKGPSGWMRIDTANVYFDHPYHAPLDHALAIDFVCEADGARERVAVELSAASARELVTQDHGRAGERRGGASRRLIGPLRPRSAPASHRKIQPRLSGGGAGRRRLFRELPAHPQPHIAGAPQRFGRAGCRRPAGNPCAPKLNHLSVGQSPRPEGSRQRMNLADLIRRA